MTTEMKAVIKAAQRQGLLYDPHGKHPKIRDPKTGRAVSISNTPSCPYAAKNVLRDVRRFLGVSLS